MPPPRPDPYRNERLRMVTRQLACPDRGITDPRVLEAMEDVPRHAFVPEDLASLAYADRPLPIGYDQTISQPFIVAFMTQALGPRRADRVLEIGTGSGYQAAVLSRIVARVHTLEIIEPLARRAAATLAELGCHNVTVHLRDGHQGCPEEAPFDAIIVTCAPAFVPESLLDQLRPDGRMIVPVGRAMDSQELILLRRRDAGFERESILPVRFVPMTGTPLDSAST